MTAHDASLSENTAIDSALTMTSEYLRNLQEAERLRKEQEPEA
jgi:hypothetical protein